MIVLISGGRKFTDDVKITQGLVAIIQANDLNPDNTVWVHGGAIGLDMTAHRILQGWGYHVARVDALWDLLPVSAGPKRNTAMLLLKPDLVAIFPGGSGTADMKRRAVAADIPTVEVKFDD